MALPSINGIFDVENDKIIGTNTATWDDIGAGDSAGENAIQSWDEWRSWIAQPTDTLTWQSQLMDMSISDYYVFTLTIDCAGTPSYTIYGSTTGNFTGEETSVTIDPGDDDVAAVQGRYFIVHISVAYVPSEGPPEIRSFDWSGTSRRVTAYQFDLNSADLSGPQTARQLDPPRNFGKILTMRITPISSYVTDDYVVSGYVEHPVAPYAYIVSKDRTTPELAFADNDGNTADSQFDIEYVGLPEMYMDGRDLRIR